MNTIDAAAVAGTALFAEVKQRITTHSETLTLVSGDHLIPAGHTWRFEAGASLVVGGSSRVILQSSDQCLPARIEFAGVNERIMIGGGMEFQPSDQGLWVLENGRLEVRGERVTPWLRLATDARANDTTLKLERVPDGWRVGGSIAITPTLARADGPYWRARDEAKIAAIDGKVVTLEKPLVFDHPLRDIPVPVSPLRPGLVQTVTLGAEVVYLDRACEIEAVEGGRAHVLVRSGRPQLVSYGAFRHLGPKGVLGRYGYHMHHCKDASRGSVIEGCVVEDWGSHAFVPHSSHGVQMLDCVAYDGEGDAFWWDLGDSTNDLHWEQCLAAKVINTELTSITGFFLGHGSGLHCRGCVAADVEGRSKGSGFHWPTGTNGPDVWEWADCVAHNLRSMGIDVWQNTIHRHHLSDGIAYSCGLTGFSIGAYRNGYRLSELAAQDCGEGIRHHVSTPEAPFPHYEGSNLALTECDYPIRVAENNKIPDPLDRVSTYRDCTLTCTTGGKLVWIRNPSVAAAQHVDFVGCVIGPEDVRFDQCAPGSQYRFQNTTDAFLIDDSGDVDSIELFVE